MLKKLQYVYWIANFKGKKITSFKAYEIASKFSLLELERIYTAMRGVS